MDRADKYAFEAAKEITIAALNGTALLINEISAAEVATFFETVHAATTKAARNIQESD